MSGTVYTIGHSNQTLDSFLAALRAHSVTAIGDVRSYPYSNANPQFDRETLAAELQTNGVAYVFLGKELGARNSDQSCYVDGKVQYEALAKTKLFEEGLERVLKGMGRFTLSFMCAEAEPLFCHRAILVSRHLQESKTRVKHILKGEGLEDHDESIRRLLRILDMNNHDMFLDEGALFSEAYRIQGEKIAYELPSEENKKQSALPRNQRKIFLRELRILRSQDWSTYG